MICRLWLPCLAALRWQHVRVLFLASGSLATSRRPILHAIAAQFLACHMAVLMGTDVDQPRNLAKSVTVE